MVIGLSRNACDRYFLYYVKKTSVITHIASENAQRAPKSVVLLNITPRSGEKYRVRAILWSVNSEIVGDRAIL